MEVRFREGPGFAVVAPSGRLSPRTTGIVRDALLKAFAEQPSNRAAQRDAAFADGYLAA